jgi:outer membrane protein TolC
MIFSGEAGTPAGVNPLVSPSLKYLSLPNGSPSELETARQLLEQWRRRAEARFGVAKQRFRAGEITRSTYDEQRAALEAALVNYQHGMRAYRAALSQTAGN